MTDKSNYTLLAQPSWRDVKPLAQTPFALSVDSVFFRLAIVMKNISTLNPSLQDMTRSS